VPGLAWVAVGILTPILVALLVWLTAPRSTNRVYLQTGIPSRMWRRYRMLWQRGAATVAGWPHLVDVALGTRRVATGTAPAEVVWDEGRATLRRYDGPRTHPEPVLVVHALVTRPWILDLTEERSLIRRLVAEGLDVYLLDWGDPAAEDAGRDLEDHALTLMRAEQEVLAISGAERVHLVGYCLGGTLCLARAAAWPDPFLGSLVMIAPPIDTEVRGGIGGVLRRRALRPVLALDQRSMVPPSLVRESFHLLRRRAIETVLGRIVGRVEGREAKDAYAALARWVWEHRPLPGALFLDIVDLFRENALWHGELRFEGERRAELSRVAAPMLLVIADRDHIVPAASSMRLTERDLAAPIEVLASPGGHVSTLMGRWGREVVWPGMAAWLADRQAG